MGEKRGAGWREADLVALDDVFIQSAPGQIVQGQLPLRMAAQLLAIEFASPFQRVDNGFVGVGLEFLGGPGDFQAELSGQQLNGFRKAQAVELLHEVNHAAVGAAAKTMVVLVAGVRVNIQGRGLFLMKRAAGRIVGARLL